MSRLLLLAALLLPACRGLERAPAGADPTTAVSAPAPRPAPAPIELVGVVTSARSEVVSAEFDARVLEVKVRGGERVKAGDVIAILDDRQLKERAAAAAAAEDAARAEVGRASVEVREARRRLANEQRLYRRGAQAREAVSGAQAMVSGAGAGAGLAGANLRKFRHERQEVEGLLQRSVLRAPIDGVVSLIKVKEGEMAQRGTRVARVFDPRDLRVKFEVPRGKRELLATGTKVTVVLDDGRTELSATIVDVSEDLEPPLSFAIGEADIDESTAAARVGGEVRVRI
jgi:RND family efflux transporter MFP subunit